MAKPAARLQQRKDRPNQLDAAGITYIDYKDTVLLRKFISDRGKIRSRRVTRLSPRQQRGLTALDAGSVIGTGIRPIDHPAALTS